MNVEIGDTFQFEYVDATTVRITGFTRQPRGEKVEIARCIHGTPIGQCGNCDYPEPMTHADEALESIDFAKENEKRADLNLDMEELDNLLKRDSTEDIKWQEITKLVAQSRRALELAEEMKKAHAKGVATGIEKSVNLLWNCERGNVVDGRVISRLNAFVPKDAL